MTTGKKKIALVLGSDSDLPVAQKTAGELDRLGIPYEVRVMSAHRTPGAAAAYAARARQDGFGVLIAFAGMAAHLAGVLAAQTTLPVIGVPCAGGFSDGMDALLSTVQMPPGVPVATVAVGGGANAALLAAQILSLSDDVLAQTLERRKTEMRDTVAHKDAAVRRQFEKSES